MPLLEEQATTETACVSTAPVFTKNSPEVDGAAKSHDPGWWALMMHNADRRPGARSSWAVSALWLVWLAAFSSTAFIPVPGCFLQWNVAVIGLALVSIWLPDYGDTVLPYYSVVILPMVAFKSAAMGGLWTYSIIPYIFVVIPAFDFVAGVDVGNQSREIQRELHHAFRFELLTLLVAPAVLLSQWYGAWLCSFGGLSAFESVGVSISVGAVTGIVGIVAGHELCHKASLLERACGRLLLCSAGYGHFYVEHTLGHHKHIGTDLDPASARYGETFYEFLPRVVRGEFLSACHIEADRLRRKGLQWWHSEIPLYFLVSACLAGALVALTGPPALPFFLLQSGMAVLLFESVNYLEHYGLERREVRPGQYEPVQPKHSWDSPARVTNHLLFKLERHADHHAHAGKRYQTLQAYEESPQLPAGYATMILLALVPPLWRAVMHPRLHAWRRAQGGQHFRHGPSFGEGGGASQECERAHAVPPAPSGAVRRAGAQVG